MRLTQRTRECGLFEKIRATTCLYAVKQDKVKARYNLARTQRRTLSISASKDG